MDRSSHPRRAGHPGSSPATPPLTLEEAKTRLDVATLWRRLGLPDQPAKSCRCPLHEDRTASFSVYPGKGGDLRWKCHAGCGEGGPVELLARVLNLPERDACRRLLELAGGGLSSFAPTVPTAPTAPTPPPERRVLWPADGLRLGTRTELFTLARGRGLSFQGIALTQARGLLRFAAPLGWPIWLVTDRAAVNAQARRLDGRPWAHLGGAKAWTLPGSRAAWPIGAREARDVPNVVLVEGAPDLLAAHHFILAEGREHDTAAVAMLGASCRIPDDALPCLAGKRVRLFPHTDPAGKAAAWRWSEQLRAAGCDVDAFHLTGLCRADGHLVNDLNDLANLDPDAFEEQQAALLEVLPR